MTSLTTGEAQELVPADGALRIGTLGDEAFDSWLTSVFQNLYGVLMGTLRLLPESLLQMIPQ